MQSAAGSSETDKTRRPKNSDMLAYGEKDFRWHRLKRHCMVVVLRLRDALGQKETE